jgi:hypothetical protein
MTRTDFLATQIQHVVNDYYREQQMTCEATLPKRSLHLFCLVPTKSPVPVLSIVHATLEQLI